MPIAIIVTDAAIPAIIEEQTDAALLAAIDALAITPNGMDIELTKAWLAARLRPSGWYAGRAEAQSAALAAARTKRAADLSPEDIKDARKSLGMSRVAFGQALGFGGNPNTVNKTVYELETDPRKNLRPEKQEILFGLLAAQELAGEDAA